MIARPKFCVVARNFGQRYAFRPIVEADPPLRLSVRGAAMRCHMSFASRAYA